MRKILFTLAVVLFTTAAVVAQPRAIGVRFGYNIEASYQHGLGEANYIQLDAGLIYYSSGIQLAGTYNWIFATPEWGDYGTWEWFGGIGAGLGYNWSLQNAHWKGTVWTTAYSNNWHHFFVGAAGNVGLSFTFEFPLQLSVDYHPVIGPSFGEYWVNSTNNPKRTVALYAPGFWDFGVSARYTF
jgi:hypothetical protein